MLCSRLRPFVRSMSTTALPASSIPLLTTVPAVRQWREAARKENKSVGFVPTMGALHDGHMSLVRRSLAENDLTILSIFVNPAQFAPHEDLATAFLCIRRSLATQEIRTASAVFLPSVKDMYPSGFNQDPAAQKGTFIEVKGYGEQMEGKSRPTFFRGVATAVIKLFNAIEPTNAYFGQKDIQQCFIVKRLCGDLLLSHPDPEHIHIVPTARDPFDNLALSSRNAYLSAEGRKLAPTLYRALKVAEQAWNDGFQKVACVERATDLVREVAGTSDEAQIRLDYIEFNDSDSLEPLESTQCREPGSQPVLLSGAMWVGSTRLIDNIVLEMIL
ncbi:Pantoate-beta-alanine ligase [Mycena sanguinolenta]|uniref:Pantoate--beta-alanine ligase n=1 Tax=Mycena sanguinolenta TaxID=230812 RepID=A0A8H7DFP2_9AGAR|nr:Pantoate-beta-alanine ligase [Mycena sanguinolenta]